MNRKKLLRMALITGIVVAAICEGIVIISIYLITGNIDIVSIESLIQFILIVGIFVIGVPITLYIAGIRKGDEILVDERTIAISNKSNTNALIVVQMLLILYLAWKYGYTREFDWQIAAILFIGWLTHDISRRYYQRKAM
ncbi:MAG TPA: hypothetical protein EYP67_00560 [Methanosarcinales archaeon]|nr:hypothetical protein [Methanosarcinales archaeon]